MCDSTLLKFTTLKPAMNHTKTEMEHSDKQNWPTSTTEWSNHQQTDIQCLSCAEMLAILLDRLLDIFKNVCAMCFNKHDFNDMWYLCNKTLLFFCHLFFLIKIEKTGERAQGCL